MTLAEVTKYFEEQRANGSISYTERNLLIALIVKLLQNTGAGKAWKAKDLEQDEEWQNVVFIQLDGKQMSWHIPAGEMRFFPELREIPNSWDGHTGEEKYTRLLEYVQRVPYISKYEPKTQTGRCPRCNGEGKTKEYRIDMRLNYTPRCDMCLGVGTVKFRDNCSNCDTLNPDEPRRPEYCYGCGAKL